MIKKIISYLRSRILLYRYPNCHSSVHIGMDVRVYEKKNLVMEEETNIDRGAIIMNTRERLYSRNGRVLRLVYLLFLVTICRSLVVI